MSSKVESITQVTVPLSQAPPLQIPVFGLGVYQSTKTYESVSSALSAGYRHFDTAQIYRNESLTASAIKDFLAANPSASRSDIFVCSKLWEWNVEDDEKPPIYTKSGAIEGLDRSLAAMGEGIDYIDLYLLHNPRPGPEPRLQAWLGLQEGVKAGKAKSIGVSNWSKAHIEQLIAHPDVHLTPAVNQIEFHPWCQHRELVKYCKEKGIVVVAYSPLTQGTRLHEPLIVELAEKYGKTNAQIVLRWCLQMGVVIIPKSDKEHRIKENMGLYGWELSQEDVDQITALDEGISGKLGEWDPDAWE